MGSGTGSICKLEGNGMKERRGPVRAVKALEYSWGGLKAAWRHEESFRQEVILGSVMLPFAFVIGEGFVERALLVGVVLLVWVVELLNSAIEALTDRMGTEHHELSGRAKDLGSAAVMLTLILAGGFWGFKTLIFMGRL